MILVMHQTFRTTIALHQSDRENVNQETHKTTFIMDVITNMIPYLLKNYLGWCSKTMIKDEIIV